jgi:hypothetical protein
MVEYVPAWQRRQVPVATAPASEKQHISTNCTLAPRAEQACIQSSHYWATSYQEKYWMFKEHICPKPTRPELVEYVPAWQRLQAPAEAPPECTTYQRTTHQRSPCSLGAIMPWQWQHQVKQTTHQASVAHLIQSSMSLPGTGCMHLRNQPLLIDLSSEWESKTMIHQKNRENLQNIINFLLSCRCCTSI